MSTITARFITPRKPVAGAAFAGLTDLWRIFFQPGRSMPVVCSECQTINRFSAKVCKGCDGKLPAFYTAGGADGTPSLSGAMGARARLLASRARAFRVPARWVTVACVAVALAVLFGAFGLWYAMYSSAAGHPVPVQTQLAPPAHRPAQVPSAAVGDRPAADPPSATLVTAAAQPLAPPAAGAPSQEAVEAPSSTARPAVAPVATRPDLRQRASSGEPLAAPARRVGSGPLALCGGLQFLAHAICMNNTCAQPAHARNPQCAQALRQRRMDEARRNPTLVN